MPKRYKLLAAIVLLGLASSPVSAAPPSLRLKEVMLNAASLAACKLVKKVWDAQHSRGYMGMALERAIRHNNLSGQDVKDLEAWMEKPQTMLAIKKLTKARLKHGKGAPLDCEIYAENWNSYITKLAGET
nr:hypothetical protein 10 [bacterium]